MKQLHSYLLSNEQGMRVEILNFGARVKSILFPVNDIPTEMTVGYEHNDSYLADTFYLGASCGRVANRISDASFELNGERYRLSANDGKNCLHGGVDNFAQRFWQIDFAQSTKTSVTLTLHSADGDQGFPGNVVMQVRYHLSSDNRLTINYSARTDKATPLNMTNHCYFNLGEQNCLALELQINAANYLARNAQGIPSGEIVAVANSDLCFTAPNQLGQRQYAAQHPQLKAPLGYDHCYVLEQQQSGPAAVLSSLQNKVKMSVSTDQAALQLYTGAFLDGPFTAYQGVCLEAQNYTDAVNIPHFANSIVMPGEQYNKVISYHFENI
ncbi:aldose epimerase family protein [Pseudoalteromonas sp.]|uniref:aldose epimerase family protein n=1 Tax=Pseudoalteromonas sp. TaxID=53249 RepID=UPI00356945C3